VIEKDIVKKDTKAAKSEALTKKGSTLLKKADGEEEEKHVEARLEVEKVPGSGGEEDEINIGMEVVVDPDGPNPMTTYVEAQVAEDDMVAEAEAETKAKGEAEVKAGLQRGGNKDSDAVQLDVTTKEKDSAKMRPLHADSKSADKYGLFNADAWIKKGGAKKKKKSSPSTSSSSSESSVEEPKKKPSEKKK